MANDKQARRAAAIGKRQESQMQKLLTALGKLVGGNAANGVLQLAIFAIAAQALDLSELGILILIQAYVRVIDGLFNFQSVNVLTNLLAGAQQRNDEQRVSGLIKAGLGIDFGTALIATVIAIVGVPIIAPLIGIGPDWIWLAVAFCTVIATRSFGAIEAGLRCFDRFGAISLRPVVSSAVITVTSLFAWAMSAGPETFLLIWLLGEVGANLGYMVWAMIALRRHGIKGLRAADARHAIAQSPNFWGSMWQTNFTYGLRILSQEGDILIVGAFLGEAAAALLRAAKNLAVLVGQFGKPLHQATSVPIARFVSEGRNEQALGFAWRASAAVALASLIVTAIMAFATPVVLRIGFGPEFLSAYWAVMGLLLAKTLYLSGAALPPVMIAFDITKQFTTMIAIGNVAFFAVLLCLIGPLGLMAAVLAHIAFEMVWAVYGWAVCARELQRRSSVTAAA